MTIPSRYASGAGERKTNVGRRKAWALFGPAVLVVSACAGQNDLRSESYVAPKGESNPAGPKGREARTTGDADVLEPAIANQTATTTADDGTDNGTGSAGASSSSVATRPPAPTRELTLAPGGWALPAPAADHRLAFLPGATPATAPLLVMLATASTQGVVIPAGHPGALAAPQSFPVWTGATAWLTAPLTVWTVDGEGVRRYAWPTATALPSKSVDLAYPPGKGMGAARALGVIPGAFLARRGSYLMVATEGASPTLTSYPLPSSIAALSADATLSVQHLGGGDFILVAPTVTATFLAGPSSAVWRVSSWALPSDEAVVCSGASAFVRANATATAYEGRFVLRCGATYRLSDTVSLSRATLIATPKPLTSPTPDPKATAWTNLSPILNAHCVGCHAHSFQNGDKAALPTRAWVQENAAAMKGRILRAPNTPLVMPLSPKPTWTEAVKTSSATALTELSQ